MKKTKDTITLNPKEIEILSQAADILALIHRALARTGSSECESNSIVCDYHDIEESIDTLDFFFDHPSFTLF